MPAAMLPPVRSTVPFGSDPGSTAGDSDPAVVAGSEASCAWTSTMPDKSTPAIEDAIGLRMLESPSRMLLPQPNVESRRPVNNPSNVDAAFHPRKTSGQDATLLSHWRLSPKVRSLGSQLIRSWRVQRCIY